MLYKGIEDGIGIITELGTLFSNYIYIYMVFYQSKYSRGGLCCLWCFQLSHMYVGFPVYVGHI
jgi:hypothetical protein